MAWRCEGLSVAYEEGDRSVPALVDVDVAMPAGTSVALLGASGAGKSTLLQVVRGILPPGRGRVLLDGTSPNDRSYADLQRRVGLVFQRAELQLFAASAHDDVAFGPRQLGWEPARVDEAVRQALDVVGLPAERFGRRHPYSLSGGEQRRLALAGVLAMRPRLLLLDEPFVGLDPAGRAHLSDTLRGLTAAGVSLVLATHDVDLAWRLCAERIVLHEGHLAAAGPWDWQAGGGEKLRRLGLRIPLLVDLWTRLGRPVDEAPRTAGEAAEALA